MDKFKCPHCGAEHEMPEEVQNRALLYDTWIFLYGALEEYDVVVTFH